MLMPTVSTDQLVRQAWDPRQLRRLARAFNEVALGELTRGADARGPVRAPDFARRARALLKARGGPAQTPARLRQLAAASLHLGHPCYMAQQIPAPIPMAALVESALAALNQSIAVWDMSPAGTLVDRDLMDRFKALFGLPAAAEGSLTPGGSYANLTALLAARAALAPRAWKTGKARLAILAGAHTHYSISRAAGILGLGADCVFPIPANPCHQTDPAGIAAAARAARHAGYRQLVLVATSGSTATGSFDDLEAFADAARGLGAWLHVDAAHGGGFAFHPRRRALLKGIERADSIAFDPHKMMFMPLVAGALLVRQGERLRGAFEQNAPYLFSPVRREVADVGPFTIACSQRFDALKAWLVWKAYGPRLFAALVEATCATTRAAYDYCQDSSVLEPAHEPQSNILCFRLRYPPAAATAADARHWEIKEAVNASGRAYISSTVLEGRRAFRIVVMNPRSEPRHALRVMRVVEREARRLA